MYKIFILIIILPVQVVKISYGSEDDIDPVKNVLFVEKRNLSKPSPNEFQKVHV